MNKIKKPKLQNFLFFLSFISLSSSQELIFENDSLCEIFGSSLISHLFPNGTENKNIPLKKNWYDKFGNITFSDIIRNSGSGLNDLGDYLGCKRNKAADYYVMIIGSTFNPLIQTSLGFCYYKECTNKYFQNFTEKVKNQIQKTFHLNTSLVVINFMSPDQEFQKTRKENNKGIRIILLITII